MGQTHEDMEKRRTAAVRTALVLGGVVIAIYVIFFFTKG